MGRTLVTSGLWTKLRNMDGVVSATAIHCQGERDEIENCLSRWLKGGQLIGTNIGCSLGACRVFKLAQGAHLAIVRRPASVNNGFTLYYCFFGVHQQVVVDYPRRWVVGETVYPLSDRCALGWIVLDPRLNEKRTEATVKKVVNLLTGLYR